MARELGLDPVEVRRKNLITAGHVPRIPRPWRWPMTPATTRRRSTKALELSDYAGFEARAAESAARGIAAGHGPVDLDRGLRHRTLASGGPVWVLVSASYDAATVRVSATGTIQVMTGAHSHGQGPRDGLCAGRGRQAGYPRGRGRDRPWRHLEDPVRDGQLRLAQPCGLRLGDGPGDGQDHRQGQEDRRPYARGRGG